MAHCCRWRDTQKKGGRFLSNRPTLANLSPQHAGQAEAATVMITQHTVNCILPPLDRGEALPKINERNSPPWTALRQTWCTGAVGGIPESMLPSPVLLSLQPSKRGNIHHVFPGGSDTLLRKPSVDEHLPVNTMEFTRA